MTKKYLFGAALCLAVCFAVFAQATGGVRGLVTDPSGAFVPGAHVVVTNASGIATRVDAGADGTYSVTGLAPGKYTVTASATGLSQDQPLQVNVTASVTNLTVVLSVAMQKQEVTVSDIAAPQLSVDSSQNASSITVSQELLDSLSDDPDDLQADLLALAGPGAGPNGGEIMIDGFVAGDAVLPSKNSIREIRINQNPFSPEYDAIGFGRTEILTKPGTDKLRGQVSFSYGNGAANSRNPYAPTKAPFNLEDVAGNLGGSFGKRASFFLDGEERRILNGSVVNAAYVDPSTFTTIDPYTQIFTSTVQRQRISPRVDLSLSPKNTLIIRYGMTRTHTDNGGVGAFDLASRADNENHVEHAIQVVETYLASNSVVDETRFQFLHQREKELGVNPTDLAITGSNAFAAGGFNNPDNGFVHHHYDFTNQVMISAGKHAWKFGIRARGVQVYDNTELYFNGQYTFGGAYAPILNANNTETVPGTVCTQGVSNPACQTISAVEQYRRTLLFLSEGMAPAQVRTLGGGATQFAFGTGSPRALVGQVDGAVWAGDDWRALPNLTFSYGARYEDQSNVSDPRDIAPRLAFAWAPAGGATGGKPNTVIRGGFGVFYDRFSEQNTLLANHFNGINQVEYFAVDPDTFPAIPSPASLQAMGLHPAIHTVSPNIVAAMIMQPAIGVERQLPRNTTIATTYTMSHATHELLTRNVNAPLPGTFTGVEGSGVYPYANTVGPEGQLLGNAPIYEVVSGGIFNQHQIVTNVNSRINSQISLFGYYVLGWVRDTSDGANGFGLNNNYPANQYSMAGEYGPGATDIRHIGTIGGNIQTFWKLRLAPLITVQSGAPFDITTSQDIYGSNLPGGIETARPAFANNPSTPGLVQTKYGLLDPDPSPGERLLPRNYGRGPGMFSIDLRLARTFSLVREKASKGGSGAGGGAAGAAPSAGPARRGSMGGFGQDLGTGGGGSSRSLAVSVSGRNLFNHLNPGPIVGNINSPLFGQSNQIAGGVGAFSGSANNRRLEFQAILSF